MARKTIKFSLKMKNGAEVRSIEELRANADVESIMKYYFSGQLSLWCKAFNYEELPSIFDEIKYTFVKSICDTLDLKLSIDEMQKYVQNCFGVADTSRITEASENEEKIIDNVDIKNKLRTYTLANLDDYEINVIPIENENGKIEKCHVSVVCEKTEQYYRFTLPYDLSGSYTRERFVDDLYKKIARSITLTQENDEYNKLKNSRYAGLKVGDTFEFGKFEGKAITWRILKKSNDTMYVISNNILCDRVWDSGNSSNWNDSDIRKWLNEDFFNSAFSAGEKEFIGDVSGDRITLLTKEEGNELLDNKSRTLGSRWWLRSHNTNGVWSSAIGICLMSNSNGVRPTFNLKF